MKLSNCLITDNVNYIENNYEWQVPCGTIFKDTYASLDIDRCTIADNWVDTNDNDASNKRKQRYGAIFNHQGPCPSVTDSIMWGNRSVGRGMGPGETFSGRDYDRWRTDNPLRISNSDTESTASTTAYYKYSDAIPHEEVEDGSGNGCLHVDPQFADPGTGDYRPLNPDCAGMGARF